MSSREKEVIPIIYWTTWFGTNQWQDYTIDNCNLPVTCKITHDRDRAVDSSVLIFHASDIDNKADFPPLKRDRAWVYHNAEAPKSNQVEIMKQMQYSMTYRLDSDFPWGYFESSLLKRMGMSKNPHKKKVPIAWIVSNCKASNYRHHFVKELRRHIDIDIYGHCMNNQLFPDNKTTIELMQEYHFYLTLENSNCKDYVTEKLYNAYVAGTIPIVDGPSDYAPFIPNTNAVIRVDDFKEPKLLADYIKQVLSDKQLYEGHLNGGVTNKQFLMMMEAYEKGKCNLCQLAYERHTGNPISFYPGKKLYADNTCIESKHYRFKYTLGYQLLILFCISSFFVFLYFHRNSRLKIQRLIKGSVI